MKIEHGTVSPLSNDASPELEKVSFEVARQISTDSSPEGRKSEKLWKSLINNLMKNRIELLTEITAIIIVFSVTLWYFLNVESTNVIQLSNDKSSCKPFKNVYSIQSQSATLNFVYSFYTEATLNDTGFSNVHSVKVSGYWSSCAMTVVSEEAPVLKSSSGWEGLYSYAVFSITNSSHDQVAVASVVTNATYFNGTVIKESCFELVCGVQYGNNLVYDGPTLPTRVSETYRENNGLITAQIIVTESAVSASCAASLFGVPINYYSVSNSIQLGNSGLCTVYYSTWSAIGLSLPYSMTIFSIVKAVFYFRDLWGNARSRS